MLSPARRKNQEGGGLERKGAATDLSVSPYGNIMFTFFESKGRNSFDLQRKGGREFELERRGGESICWGALTTGVRGRKALSLGEGGEGK